MYARWQHRRQLPTTAGDKVNINRLLNNYQWLFILTLGRWCLPATTKRLTIACRPLTGGGGGQTEIVVSLAKLGERGLNPNLNIKVVLPPMVFAESRIYSRFSLRRYSRHVGHAYVIAAFNRSGCSDKNNILVLIHDVYSIYCFSNCEKSADCEFSFEFRHFK